MIGYLIKSPGESPLARARARLGAESRTEALHYHDNTINAQALRMRKALGTGRPGRV